MTGTLSGIRVPIFGGPLAEGRLRTGTVAAIVAVVIAGGAAAVPGVAPAETQPDDTTDDIPDLPDLRGVDG